MRTFLRLLPALLILLVPLLFLGWLGSVEFGRLDERTSGILRDQAHSFLMSADRKVRQILRDRARYRLEAAIDMDERGLVEASRELSNEDPWFLNLFLLDGRGSLVFPQPPLSNTPALTLLDLPVLDKAADPRSEFRTAHLLARWGDDEGARQLLERYVEGFGQNTRNIDKRYLSMRAYFMLAGLLRKTKPRDAEEHYQFASFLAEDLAQRQARRLIRCEAAAIRLFADTALAELSEDNTAQLDVLRDIAYGVHDQNAEELLDAVFQRLAAAIPEESAAHAAIQSARQDNEIRKSGRRFASLLRAQANRDLALALRRSTDQSSAEPILHVLSGPGNASLLALRRALPTEKERFGATLVGVRLDFAALLGEDLDTFLSGTEGSTFLLAIVDPAGVPILPAAPPQAEEFPIAIAPIESEAGLRLHAIPIANPVADVQATERNRLLLVLALVLAAVFGAIFLLRAVNREHDLARLKVKFVSRVSHELRTPLSVIKMYGDTLTLGRAENAEQVSRFAGIISREADRLTAMVERILDFSKQQAGTMNYAAAPVDLGGLLQEVTDEYLPHVQAQGADLKSALANGLVVSVDKNAMASVYVNLVENAVKYTPKDQDDRIIEVELARNNGHACLQVLDHGVGIPDNERHTVFQPFYRATTAGEVRGAGLGLSMVQHFAEAHGGDIEALERPGGGTIMRMTLPLAAKNRETTPE